MKEIIVAVVGSEERPAKDVELDEVKRLIREGLSDGVIVVPAPCKVKILPIPPKMVFPKES